MTRVYIVFKRARSCIRIYTDLSKSAVKAAVDEALSARKSLFLTVYEPNGNGFKRSHVTATPYEILRDCSFYPQPVVLCEERDQCAALSAQARELREFLNQNGVEGLNDQLPDATGH